MNFLFIPEFETLKIWVKDLEPATRTQSRVPFFDCKFLVRGLPVSRNLARLGGKFGTASVAGGSLIFGTILFKPQIAFCGDQETLADDECTDLMGAPDQEDNHNAFWANAVIAKFWLPVLFAVTVMLNLDQPIQLLMRVILFLLSTKPRPLSIYLFVEQLRYQFIHQEPSLSGSKSLYANKVDVHDYRLFCLARVEMRNQKLTLVGILGGWWPLPLSPSLGASLALTISRIPS